MKQQKSHLFLVGFMGAGKTTVGKILSERLKKFYYDLDREIEKQENKTVTEIFSDNGEQYFRDIESKILIKVCMSKNNSVISTGGGIVIKEKNREVMSDNGKTFYLKADFETLWDRISNSKKRPLLNVEGAYEIAKELLNQREYLYEMSDYIVETDNQRPEMVVEKIVDLLITDVKEN